VSPEEGHRLELQIAALRTVVETGFGAVRGDLNLLARGETMNIKELEDHDTRLKDLEARRIPQTFLGPVLSLAAIAVSAIALLKGG
jgi:hypothetical protein